VSSVRGFTLIEVLVALVIVAAGAAAVLSALNGAASSTTYLRDKTFAQWIAANRIAELRLARAPPRDGTDDGELDYAGRRWAWRQEIKDADIPGLRRIDVSVRPAELAVADGDSWTVTLSGVLGRDLALPTGAEPDWEPAPEGAPPQPADPPASDGSPAGPAPAAEPAAPDGDPTRAGAT
jgi:general secretion pathway protein I